jgi:hypothetical protein
VPKATVHENDYPSLPDDDVGTPGKLFGMESISHAEAPECSTDIHLWPSVLCAN